MTDEVLFITRNIQGVTAEYLDNKPVPLRKRLVNEIAKAIEEAKDGSGMVPKHNHKSNN